MKLEGCQDPLGHFLAAAIWLTIFLLVLVLTVALSPLLLLDYLREKVTRWRR